MMDALLASTLSKRSEHKTPTPYTPRTMKTIMQSTETTSAPPRDDNSLIAHPPLLVLAPLPKATKKRRI